VVFNGDVFTSVDLPAALRLHRARHARATIVLTPVEDPTAYGLVETDAHQNVTAFLEKPSADEIRCDTINAGIYILEPETLDRIPANVHYSIERGYFPSLVANGETFVAYVDRGYWLDIGAPDKYRQAHHDIMSGRFVAPPFATTAGESLIAPDAQIAADAVIEAPCFIGAGAVIDAGARIGRNSVIGAHSHIGEGAVVDGAILWPETRVDAHAHIGAVLAGHHCHFGRHVTIGDSAMFGDGSVVTDFSKA
jgi:mannose-1-phosphate guanylyltransferase